MECGGGRVRHTPTVCVNRKLCLVETVYGGVERWTFCVCIFGFFPPSRFPFALPKTNDLGVLYIISLNFFVKRTKVYF